MNKFVRYSLFPWIYAILGGLGTPLIVLALGKVPTATLQLVRGAFIVLYMGVAALFIRPKVKLTRRLIVGAVLVAVFTMTANLLFHTGMLYSKPGKAAFLSALYVVLIPFFGIFTGRRVFPIQWAALGVLIVGMYFLCCAEDMRIDTGEIIVILSAVFYALECSISDKYVQSEDEFVFLFVQMVASLFMLLPLALVTDGNQLENVRSCLGLLALLAVFSVTTFLLMVYSMKGGNIVTLSIVWSMASAFALIFDYFILDERLTRSELLGCAIVLVAVILAQLGPNTIQLSEKRRSGGAKGE